MKRQHVIAVLVMMIALTAIALGRAVSGADAIELTGAQLEAFRLGVHRATDDVEKECIQRGKFQVQVGHVTRSYTCRPDWI